MGGCFPLALGTSSGGVVEGWFSEPPSGDRGKTDVLEGK